MENALELRFLMMHVDYFKSTITERGRSRFVEETQERITETQEAILVLASVEKGDESALENVAKKAAKEISENASHLKVHQIVLHPFAHLFGELSRPEAAAEVLRMVQAQLVSEGFSVARTPFGWFNTLELRAKGHPLSRVARIVNPS